MMKLAEPTNSSKRFPFLTDIVSLFSNRDTISVDSVIDFYLQNYPCKENRKEIVLEITKIVKFNNFNLYICSTDELHLLCISFKGEPC